MKRRNFLKGLAVAPAAVKPTAEAVAKEAMMDLNPAGAIIGGDMIGVTPSVGMGSTDWAKKELDFLRSLSREQREQQRLERVVARLEPDIAGLKSVSPTNKVRMSRDIQFERDERNRESWLDAVISGRFKSF